MKMAAWSQRLSSQRLRPARQIVGGGKAEHGQHAEGVDDDGGGGGGRQLLQGDDDEGDGGDAARGDADGVHDGVGLDLGLSVGGKDVIAHCGAPHVRRLRSKGRKRSSGCALASDLFKGAYVKNAQTGGCAIPLGTELNVAACATRLAEGEPEKQSCRRRASKAELSRSAPPRPTSAPPSTSPPPRACCRRGRKDRAPCRRR